MNSPKAAAPSGTSEASVLRRTTFSEPSAKNSPRFLKLSAAKASYFNGWGAAAKRPSHSPSMLSIEPG